jgi:glycolate oxidase iron-sulfur subunit
MQASAQSNDSASTNASARTRIAALADQCVKCGLCLPLCPTYRIAGNEAESPRGRIAFAQALAGGQLGLTPTLSKHLDQCLACTSCERVCPSHVSYDELLVATRSLIRESSPAARQQRWLGFLLARPRLLRAGLRLANLTVLRACIQSRIMQWMLRPFAMDRFARELPHLPQLTAFPQRVSTPSRGPSRGTIGLFLGCVASEIDRDVHAGATRLLGALGYDVVVPRGQGCCGTLALHAGDIEGADALAASTRRVFLDGGVVDNGVDTVLVSACGCYGTLRDRTFAGTRIQVRDISEFLAGDDRIDALKFRPLDRRIALHTPCTQGNAAATAILRLLRRIPQLEIASLPDEPRCCGAAGDYFLRHAAIADTLRTEKLDQAVTLVPDRLVTSNVGCRMFLDNGLRQRGNNIPVAHPIALLAQQLDN